MAKHPKPEEIVAKLRQADVLISQGQSVSDAIRAIGVSAVTYRRALERRDLLHTQGGTDRHRKLETSLQHCPPPRIDRIPPAGPGGVRASLHRLAVCACPTSSAGHATRGGAANRALTSKSDHLVGADQEQLS